MDELQYYVPVKYDDILSSLDIVIPIISDIFGPSDGKVLMTTGTGTVNVTSDGTSVLKSLSLTHPVARVIIEFCAVHHSKYGDGAKSCFLMIHAGFSALCQNKHSLCVNRSSKIYLSSKQKIIMSLNWFKDIILGSNQFEQWLVDTLALRIVLNENLDSEILQVMHSIVLTSLIGKFSKPAAESLAHLILEMVEKLNMTSLNLIQTINHTIKYFEEIVVENPGALLQENKVLNGIVMPLQFPDTFKCYDQYVNAVLVQWNDELRPDTETHLNFKNNLDKINFFSYPSMVMQDWIKNVLKANVSIIFHQGKAKESFKCICEEYDVGLLDCLTVEQTQYISNVLKIQPLYDITDVVSKANITTVKVEEIQLVSCFFVLITSMPVESDTLSSNSVVSVLVCSPSPGLCSQYKTAMYNALLCLQHWIHVKEDVKKQSNKCILEGRAISGGGFLPLVLNTVFSDLTLLQAVLSDLKWSQQMLSSYESAKEIICEMLIIIPKTLHKNAPCIKDRNSRFIQHLIKTKADLIKSCDIFTPSDSNVFTKTSRNERNLLEPLKSQVANFSNAIDGIIQVLKVDDVISIKSPQHHEK
ncbi:T-complex protein 1 subunit alpha-like [Clavelina lepadiformis]|uniref:T-complex protein 1 subunit alpha-like n=1 Tax=Clavelina lepadiformis TaxID=159417 RepID=UPI0040412314